MIDPTQLQVTAMNVQHGSLAHRFAEQICYSKHTDPYDPAPLGMLQWQAEIYRVLLETGLEIAVRSGQ